MWACPICDEWIVRHRLCRDCDKIRQLCKIYTKETLLKVLDKTLVIQQMKKEKPAQDVGDESHDDPQALVRGC